MNSFKFKSKCYFQLIVLSIISVSNLPSSAQRINAINRYIENPQMFAENQEPTHVPLISFQTIEEALEDNWSKSLHYLSLDGNWKFKWAINPLEAPEEFYKDDCDVSSWDDIPVPSVWQMQGYGHCIYRNIPQALHPFNPPLVPDDLNSVGCYKRSFTLPQNWNGRQIFLHFEGVKSASFVWVNGKYVGYDQGGMTPAEYNITTFLVPGENTVAVKVFRWSDGSYLEDQDMWRFSGIYRSVYLFSTPSIHIRDFFVKTDLDAQYVDAQLLIRSWIKNYTSKEAGKFAIQIKLYDKNGNIVVTSKAAKKIGASEELVVELKKDLKNPCKWSAEKPYLYSLTLELINSDGQTVEVLSEKVGFRELEIKNGLATVNGVPVEFRGVNKHQHHPDFGRTMPVEMMKKDIELMKQFNVNAVRLSHYPNDRTWYELTDEYGIYVQDEVNAESHFAEFNLDGKYGQNWFAQESAWEDAFMDRFVRMVQRDKNNPSVVMWSTGNEAGTGAVHFKMAEYARKVDGTRLIMHQCNRPSGYAPYVDIYGPRYPSPEKLRKLAESESKPIVMGEYAHAMGNSLGHFDEFWKHIREYKRLQGGFIWDWADQGLRHNLIMTPDLTQNGNDGVLMGRPQIVEGKFGKAVALSGLDDWIEIYDDPSLDITSDQLTLEAWIYPRGWSRSGNPFITKGDHQYVLEQDDKDSLKFSIHSGAEKISAVARAPGDWNYNWHHIAGIYDGKSLQLVIDGKILATKDRSGTIDHCHFPVNIGKNAERNHSNHAGWLSNALIDEVRIYERALALKELGRRALAEDAVLCLNFDEVADTGKTFLSYGIDNFCINGVIFVDRKPQPELWQMKKSHAPVGVEPVDLAEGKVNIVNYHHFTKLKELNASWQIQVDDQIVQKGIIDLDIPPQKSKLIEIPFDKPVLTAGAEAWLTISFKLPQATPWAPKGHEVTFEQFKLPFKAPLAAIVSLKETSEVNLNEIDNTIEISGDGFFYKFNKEIGSISSLIFQGQELLTSGPMLNVWRPVIPNESSHWGKAEAVEWWELGLDRLEHKVKSIMAEKVTNKEVKVHVQTVSFGSEERRESSGFECIYEYSILASGDILLKHKIIPFGEMPWIQKVGLRMELPGEFENFSWYGRGPIETYPDRKTGAKIGVYKGKVNDQYVPYVVPQEHGNKTDVRWAALTNDNSIGLAVFAFLDMNVSVSPYNPETIERARYAFQLKQSGNITFNIDYKVSGVGGTPVSPRIKYRTYPHVYEYTIRLRPFSEKSISPLELNKQRFH